VRHDEMLLFHLQELCRDGEPRQDVTCNGINVGLPIFLSNGAL
jgi:hypothetical protein